MYKVFGGLVIAIALGVAFLIPRESAQGPTLSSPESLQKDTPQNFEFSNLSSIYRFSGNLPEGWKAEFVPSIQAINIYNPTDPGKSSLEQSQIFLRFFESSEFLTLPTVTIHSRQPAVINGHDAVRYEIEKKPEVANFSSQPSWRNQRHHLIDIRFAKTPQSIFYVIARSPQVSEPVFSAFIHSLKFHNDASAFYLPLDQEEQRISKKSFGTKVSPDSSPVQPERFSGYHTGADFEILRGEENKTIAITATCGGFLRQRQTASGYGGLVVQECILNDQILTVIYGHLDLSTIPAIGTYLSPKQQIGSLEQGYSSQTDGERKHLHLGIHRGSTIDVRGYVTSFDQLSAWIDPQILLK